MSTATIHRAHALQAKHPTMPAQTRLNLAKSVDRTPVYVAELAAGQNIERDGFTLRLQVVPDDDPDTSWLGEFTDTYEPGAVSATHDHHDPRTFRYFIPAVPEEEHYQGLRDMKYGRTQARELARSFVVQDMEQARDHYPVGAIVTAHRAGVELGQASLWGIDSEDYARSWDVVGDLVDEALYAARQTLDGLCRGGQA